MFSSTSSQHQSLCSSTNASSPSRHYHAASTSSLRAAVDETTQDDLRIRAKKPRRHSSSFTAKVLHGDSLCCSDSSWFAHDSPASLPQIAVISDDAGRNSLDDSSTCFHDLLDELESLARAVKFLPIPPPPSTSLSALFEAVDLTMTPDILTMDTDLLDKPTNAYERSLEDAFAHILAMDDSGYASELSSPALSEPSLFDDLERTPRGPRPRAPSPITPMTPDSAFLPALPQFFSPYAGTVASSPMTPTTPDFSSTSPILFEYPLSQQDSATRILHHKPSKPKFLQTMLGRGRPELKNIRIPDLDDPLVARASLDAPRTASFLNFKDPKRGLRKQKSEMLFSTRKAASVDDLEMESFFNF